MELYCNIKKWNIELDTLAIYQQQLHTNSEDQQHRPAGHHQAGHQHFQDDIAELQHPDCRMDYECGA